ncbi:4276_t:CDS:1 [Ambispora gerdemannii]|uniref:4276_t:CDS:1 n=1 Tax=Ambispora gerdemannii TaxID=144530 RepID=A0A9N8VBK9_9GLOM|nr:4276_t:CDS:1 [Ambispora gerdemannii]
MMNRKSLALLVGMLLGIMCLLIYTDFLEISREDSREFLYLHESDTPAIKETTSTNSSPDHQNTNEIKIPNPENDDTEGEGEGDSDIIPTLENDNTDEENGDDNSTTVDNTKSTPTKEDWQDKNVETTVTATKENNSEESNKEIENNVTIDASDNNDDKSTNPNRNKKIPKPKVIPIKSPLRPGGGPFPIPDYKIPKGKKAEGELFLAYLTHGQFNNQRVELENALLLSYLLNRTLIIPPIIFGKKNPWKPFNTLYKNINNLNKSGLERCPSALANNEILKDCKEYNSWTIMPWDSFYEFVSLTEELGIRYIFAENFSLEWLMQRINVEKKDIFFFKDNNPYGLRFYDDPESEAKLWKFAARMNVEDLEKWPQKVLYFETLFGSGRIISEFQETHEVREKIKAAFDFTHPTVLAIANKIVDKLGGKGGYLGMHVRLSDAKFLESSDATVHDFIEQLESVSEDFDLTFILPEDYEFYDSPISFDSADDCLSKFDPLRNTLIYMATDLPQPRNHESYDALYNAYPCILTLSDFNQELEELKNLKNPKDQTPLMNFLLFMVDMIIAAKGDPFIGTHESTFSHYTKFLHNLYFSTDEDDD